MSKVAWMRLAFPLLAGCTASAPSSSATKSFQSTLASDHPDVMLLSQTAGTCSSYAYDARHVLTAAHCVYDEAGQPVAAANLSLATQAGAVPGTQVLVNPRYQPLSPDPTFDLAIVVFGADIVPPGTQVAPLAAAAPAVGDRVEIVGFGVYGFADLRPVGIILSQASQLSAAQQAYLAELPADVQTKLTQIHAEILANEQKQTPLSAETADLIRQLEDVENVDPSTGRPRTPVKREGFNHLAQIAEASLTFTAAIDTTYLDPRFEVPFELYDPKNMPASELQGQLQDQASASNGDSGSPLFAADGSVIGIASQAGVDVANVDGLSIYVNLASSETKAFFALASAQGITPPGSSAAPATATASSTSTSPGKDLYALVNDLSASDSSVLYLSASSSAAGVFYCVGPKLNSACTATTGLSTTSFRQVNGRQVFAGGEALALQQNEVVTVVATDYGGNVTDLAAFQFVPRQP